MAEVGESSAFNYVSPMSNGWEREGFTDLLPLFCPLFTLGPNGLNSEDVFSTRSFRPAFFILLLSGPFLSSFHS